MSGISDRDFLQLQHDLEEALPMLKWHLAPSVEWVGLEDNGYAAVCIDGELVNAWTYEQGDAHKSALVGRFYRDRADLLSALTAWRDDTFSNYRKRSTETVPHPEQEPLTSLEALGIAIASAVEIEQLALSSGWRERSAQAQTISTIACVRRLVMEDIGMLWVPTEFEIKHRGYIARVWHFNGKWRWGIGPDIPEGFVPLVESGETFDSSESARSDAEQKLQDPESLIRAQNYDSISDSGLAMLDRATKSAGEAMKWNVVVSYKDGKNHIEGVLREDLMATWKASINHPLNDKRVVRVERFPTKALLAK